MTWRSETHIVVLFDMYHVTSTREIPSKEEAVLCFCEFGECI